jgi:hypothetical protein
LCSREHRRAGFDLREVLGAVLLLTVEIFMAARTAAVRALTLAIVGTIIYLQEIFSLIESRTSA